MGAKNLIIRGGADFSNVKKELDKTKGQLTSFQKGLGKTMAGIGVILGGLTIGNFVKDLLQTAAKTETLNVAMGAVARSTGTSLEALKEHKKAVMELGIAEQEATQILTRFMQSQLKTADAAKVARVAQDAGTIAGMNSSEAANQMVEAIAKLRPELLTAFGFTANLNDIYSSYAKTVGKTVKQLSQAEKKQAMVNYIFREGEKIAGSYEAAMGTFGKKLGSIEKLSLPKKLMQELKTSLATPLILPGAGVVLDNMIEQLSSIKMWALDNEETLKRWGQSIAGAIRTATKGFKIFTGVIAENWQTIKFLLTTFLTYIAITKSATAATAAFRIAQLTLKGELMAQIPLLSGISRAIGVYRLQMALAPAVTNIFTGSLLRLRVALYAVHTALGPVGWAVLALSAIISGGMSLWGKYGNSLNNVGQVTVGQVKSAQESASAIEDQADAMKEAGKAAKGNLQGFDEIHQLQKDMAGSSEDLAADLDIGGVGGGIPNMDLDGMLEEIDPIKPTLAGFLEWIKQGFGKAWDWLKEGWSNFGDWLGGFWDGVKERWGSFIDWVKSWSIWDWIGGKWSSFKEWAGNLWDGVKEKWGGFTDWVGDKWSGFKATAGQIWDGVKTSVQNSWDALKTNAPIAWGNIKTSISNSWNAVSTGAKKNWDTVKSTIQSTWDNLKKNAPVAWDGIKTSVTTKASSIQTSLKKAWDESKTDISSAWTDIKSNTGIAWDGIKTSLTQTWANIKTTAGNTFNDTENAASIAWNNIKDTAGTVWGNIKTAILTPIESAKKTVLDIIESIKKSFADMKITIPKPKLPHITWSPGGSSATGALRKALEFLNLPTSLPKLNVSWYAQGGITNGPAIAGIGEAGQEAILPLERNTGWMDVLAGKIVAAIGGPAGGGAGNIYVYVGNEQVEAYVHRAQDRRSSKSNGR